MEDWGDINIIPIIYSGDFWDLFDELSNDHSKFMHNRGTILDAYKDGTLYGLRVNETLQMYNRGSSQDSIFCSSGRGYSFHLLPCFCIKENDKAIIIWTHTRARKMGFGRKMVQLLQIKYAEYPLPESIGFWEKCNVELINFSPNK